MIAYTYSQKMNNHLIWLEIQLSGTWKSLEKKRDYAIKNNTI